MTDYEINEKEAREQEATLSLDDVIEVAWRRKWAIVIPVILSTVIALILCFTLPKVYRASTTIIVDPEIISDEYMKSLLVTQPNEYMNILGATIYSRTALQKVITELGLFSDLVETVPMERLVERMRKKISLSIESGDGRGLSYFSLSYQGQNPDIVAAVVNRVVSLYIEDHFRTRGDQAVKTSEFLNLELKRAQNELKSHEETLLAFKEKNQLNLPEQRESNLRILENLMTRAQTISDNLNNAKNRRYIIQQQPLGTEGLSSSGGEEGSDATLASPLQTRFNRAKQRLFALQDNRSGGRAPLVRPSFDGCGFHPESSTP